MLLNSRFCILLLGGLFSTFQLIGQKQYFDIHLNTIGSTDRNEESSFVEDMNSNSSEIQNNRKQAFIELVYIISIKKSDLRIGFSRNKIRSVILQAYSNLNTRRNFSSSFESMSLGINIGISIFSNPDMNSLSFDNFLILGFSKTTRAFRQVEFDQFENDVLMSNYVAKKYLPQTNQFFTGFLWQISYDLNKVLKLGISLSQKINYQFYNNSRIETVTLRQINSSESEEIKNNFSISDFNFGQNFSLFIRFKF